jgi:nucleoside-diphosphate-sugar epimerase
MIIFLTGGTGFIGKKFIREALSSGHKIYAVSRKTMQSKKNLIWLKGNIDKDWSTYLKKSHVLIHMAAVGVNKDTSLKDSVTANVIKPYKLLINAINSNCINWLIIGSASEYGKQAAKVKPLGIRTKELPETNYEKSKYFFTKLSTSLSVKFKTKCRVMRLFNVYGEGEDQKRLWPSIVRAIKSKNNLDMTDGKQIRDFISVDVVAKILLNAANFELKKKNFPQIWHVASGKPTSVKSFALKNWKKLGGRKKILFNKIKSSLSRNYISEKGSIWSIK